MKYYHFVSPFLMWLIILAGSLASLTYFSDAYLFEPSGIIYVLAGALFAYWMYFFIRGITSNMQAPLRPHHITRLVTHGAYAQLRHPIYSGYLALALGAFLIYPTPGMLVAVAWFSAIMLAWARLEERSLIELFGDQYRDYMRKVSMILPLRKRKRRL